MKKNYFVLLSAFTLLSCTDKSEKFLGKWKPITAINPNNTLDFIKSGDNQFIITDNMPKNKNATKSVATYNKDDDKLVITSPVQQDINFDKTTGHLIINGFELEKVK